MDEKLQQRVELEGEIGAAIAAGQIFPFYEPIVDLLRDRRLRSAGPMGASGPWPDLA
jgi:hypothetical protein